MKAIVYARYGNPDVLRLQEVERPLPKDGEVLLEVHAASVNSWDRDLLKGEPFANRIGGLRTPRYPILGADVAGRVEAVGRSVTRFRPGDEVFGDLCRDGWGGFAEYVCASENSLAAKSPRMTFEEAAAVPQAGVLALQGLRDKGSIRPGQKVLINGAGGGAGTFAVQIAKSYGTEVTGVDSTGKLDLLRSLGADRVIDCTREDFAGQGRRYDLILDVVTYRSIFAYRRSLSPGGAYVMLGGGSWARVWQTMLLGPLISVTGSRKMGLLFYRPSVADLNRMKELFEAGKVRPVIDRCYPLRDVAEALRYFDQGRARGKVVITVKGV